MSTVSVAAAVRRFLDYSVEDVGVTTFANYNRYLRRLSRHYGHLRLDALTPAFVRQWGRTYHAVQAVQRLLSWAKKEALLISRNPCEQMRKLPRGRRLRTLTPVEDVRLRRAASREFRAFLVALSQTIARPGELRRAVWPDIRVRGLQPFTLDELRSGKAFIFLDQFKAKELMKDGNAIRVIPISPRLGRLLARLWLDAADREGPVFLNMRGRAWTHNAVICRLRRLRVRAGIKPDHRGENVVAYSYRHSGATSAICAGVDLATLSSLMGHSDVRMTARYVHLVPDHLAAALNRVHRRKRQG